MPSSRIGQRMPAARPVPRSSALRLAALSVPSVVGLALLGAVSVVLGTASLRVGGPAGEPVTLSVTGGDPFVELRHAARQVLDPLLRPVFLDRDLGGPPLAGAPAQRRPESVSVQDNGGSHTVDVQQAESQVAEAWGALLRANAERARAQSNPEVVALRAAESDLAQAQAQLLRAQVDLKRLEGPNPVMLEAAEREVLRAEATYRAESWARRTLDRAGTEALSDSTMTSAQKALDDAIARRDRLRAGPSDSEVDAARRTVSAGHVAYEAAAERVEIARREAALPELESANAAVVAARAAFDHAEARLQSLRAQTSTSTVARSH